MKPKKEKSVIGKAVDIAILKRIFKYVRPYRTNFGMAVFTTVSLAALAIVRPLLVKYTFDNYVATSNAEMVLTMTLIMFGILFLEALFQFSDAFLTNTLGQKIIKDLRIQVYKHILSFRLKYYDNTPIGTLVTRAVSDIEVIADIFSEGLIVIIGDILKVLVIIGIMFLINVKLTLIVLVPVPFLLIATYIFKKKVNKSFHDVRTQVARLNAFLQEHITGMRIVQIFNREREELKAFEKINGKHRDANVKGIMAYSIFFPVVEILSAFSLALLVWWGGNGVLDKNTSLGDVMAFILFINMMFRPIRQLADRFNTLQMGMISSERVFHILDTTDKIEDKGIVDAERMKGNVCFRNVWFAYNNENWILRDVSFEVKAGETVALVGATGAGKSSVINLLSRFYEYNKGSVQIDGVDIRDYRLSSLQKNIGVVLQDVFLFSDTIMNNITLNNSEITRDQVIEAARAVGAHDFISRLPGGYDYHVMERGAMLSVGQRQLISFIRAYVYDAKILVLDEATSSIDTESEQMIQYATEKLTQGRTSVIIAHRLATIQKADKIIVMDKGEVIEMGTHQQLLKNSGPYKRLFDLQFKEEAVLPKAL
jgi:ATP-binding cassette, subfamily B, multidrug efflux pump